MCCHIWTSLRLYEIHVQLSVNITWIIGDTIPSSHRSAAYVCLWSISSKALGVTTCISATTVTDYPVSSLWSLCLPLWKACIHLAMVWYSRLSCLQASCKPLRQWGALFPIAASISEIISFTLLRRAKARKFKSCNYRQQK